MLAFFHALSLSWGFCCEAAVAKALEINLLVFASAIEPTAGSKPDYRVPALKNSGPDIFLWSHHRKDGAGETQPHYVPLLPRYKGGGDWCLHVF